MFTCTQFFTCVGILLNLCKFSTLKQVELSLTVVIYRGYDGNEKVTQLTKTENRLHLLAQNVFDT